MGRLRAVGLLTVLHHLLDVLVHLSFQGYRQSLDAPTDAKHRNLAVESQAGNHQFGCITLLVDIMKARRRFLTHPQRIIVATPCQYQAIEMLQRIDHDRSVGHGRDDDRRTACRYHLLVITITKRSVDAFVIGGKANDGLTLRFGKSRVRITKMRLQVKCFHLFVFQ